MTSEKLGKMIANPILTKPASTVYDVAAKAGAVRPSPARLMRPTELPVMTSPASQPSQPQPQSQAQPAKARVPAKLIVRTYEDTDQADVARLYTDGLLAGQIAANDTGADIENIHEAYLNDPAAHFWVCEGEGQEGKILGMIGVAREAEHTAEIRRLRVDKAYPQDIIGGKLIEAALAHCQRSGYLKVRLDTRFQKDAALGLFERFGFQHNRTKAHQDKDLLEFYLDLYRGPKNDVE